jgi:intracellular sulfur oxidation DsrE/DsrF family protein
VVHGPALEAFVSSKANPDIRNQVKKRTDDGVAFIACGNTMKAQKLAADDMLSGFQVAEEGGVVRIADLQQQGYLYIRP